MATPLARLHTELDNADGYSARCAGAQAARRAGLFNEQMVLPVGSFSGGWRMRLNLAQALMCPSDLLLLDEPTNHLDLDAILWLEDWLKGYPGTLLLISHDRDFLDAVVDHVIHLEQRKLTLYRGGYSAFERTRAERLAQQQQAYEKQQAQRARTWKASSAASRPRRPRRARHRAGSRRWSGWKSWPGARGFAVRLSFPRSGQGLQSVAGSGRGRPRLWRQAGSGQGQAAAGAWRADRPAGSQRCRQVDPDQDALRRAFALGGRLQRGENLVVGYFAQHQLDSLDPRASPLLHRRSASPPTSASRPCAISSAASISAAIVATSRC